MATLSFVLSGCGNMREKRPFKPKSIVTGIGAMEEPAQRNFNTEELAVAKRICSAVKKRRETIEAAPGTMAYYLNFERRDCKNKIVENRKFIANIVGVGHELEYSVAEGGQYFIDVITDKSEFLSSICTSVLSDSSEPKIISNTVAGVSNKLFTVDFNTNAAGFDAVSVFIRVKDKNGAYILNNSQDIAIATGASQLGEKYIGVEKERSQYIACSGSDFQTNKQSWLNATAPKL